MGAGWNNFFEVSISIQLTEENYCDTLSPSASAGLSHNAERLRLRLNPLQKPELLEQEINIQIHNCPLFKKLFLLHPHLSI